MSKSHGNVISITSAPSTAIRSEVDSLIYQLITQYITPCIPSAVESMTRFISNKCDSVSSDSDLMQLMEIDRKFKRYKEELILNFTNQLHTDIEEWLHFDETLSDYDEQSLSEDNLSLVENSSLERKLAWQAAAKHIEMSEDFQHFQHCESRLQTLFSGTPETVPISSGFICEGFANAIDPLNLPLDMLQDFLLIFSKELKTSTTTMWTIADKELEKLGLELPVTLTRSNSDHPLHVQPSSSSDISFGNDSSIDALAQHVVSKVETLFKHQSMQAQANADASDPSSATAILFPTSELASTLTGIQSELIEQHSTLANISELIRSALANKGVEHNLSPRQDSLIDVIGLLFEYIIDDHELPDEVKKTIGLLQIPVLKLALIDKEFLSNRLHPGRQLLNTMTSVGMHCAENNDPVIQLIDETVRDIIHHFIDNPNIFEESLNNFNEGLQEIECSAQLLEEHERAQTSINEDLEPPETAVETAEIESIIASYTHRYTIPDSLFDLVYSGWPTVLQHPNLHDQPDEVWYHKINTLELLLWNLQDEHIQTIDEDDWLILKQDLYSLLSKTNYNPQAIAEWLDAINIRMTGFIELEEEIVLEKYNRTEHKQDDTETSTFSTEPTETDEFLEETMQPLHSDSDTTQLTVGQWVEFVGKNKHQLSCKLESIHSDHYTFVNQSGMKVAELTKLELQQAIQEQRMLILDDPQFFDRALKAVMTKFLKI